MVVLNLSADEYQASAVVVDQYLLDKLVPSARASVVFVVSQASTEVVLNLSEDVYQKSADVVENELAR